MNRKIPCSCRLERGSWEVGPFALPGPEADCNEIKSITKVIIVFIQTDNMDLSWSSYPPAPALPLRKPTRSSPLKFWLKFKSFKSSRWIVILTGSRLNHWMKPMVAFYLGVNDTQIDSIQYLNFAKKWFNSILFHKNSIKKNYSIQ